MESGVIQKISKKNIFYSKTWTVDGKIFLEKDLATRVLKIGGCRNPLIPDMSSFTFLLLKKKKKRKQLQNKKQKKK